jgi:hypothetical protein
MAPSQSDVILYALSNNNIEIEADDFKMDLLLNKSSHRMITLLINFNEQCNKLVYKEKKGNNISQPRSINDLLLNDKIQTNSISKKINNINTDKDGIQLIQKSEIIREECLDNNFNKSLKNIYNEIKIYEDIILKIYNILINNYNTLKIKLKERYINLDNNKNIYSKIKNLTLTDIKIHLNLLNNKKTNNRLKIEKLELTKILEYKIYEIEEIEKLKKLKEKEDKRLEDYKNKIIELSKNKNNSNFNNCINIILNNINIKLDNLQKIYNLDKLKNYKI